MKRSAIVIVAFAAFIVSAPGRAGQVVLDFGPEEIVQAGGQDIVVAGYSVPSFADWNNDLLQDLIVGEGGNGALGKVRVYLNRGTEADPCFADYFYVQSNGRDLACAPAGCLGCFPRFVRWDADDYKDLLIGLGDGTVRIYLNVGDANEPTFDGGTNVMTGEGDVFPLDVGNRATPVPVRWDDDALLDLVVGDADGYFHVYYNCGCGGGVPPHFYFSTSAGLRVQENGHDLQVPGLRSSPVILDLDGDGKKDVLTGNTSGQILFYRNVGLDSLPMFAGYTPVQSAGQPIDLPGSLRSRPFLCHWTGEGAFGPRDGYWDLLVGYGDSKVRLYRGIPRPGDFNGDGAIDAADFTLLAKAVDRPVPPEGSPVDLNVDGVVDVLDLRLFVDIWLAEYDPQDAN